MSLLRIADGIIIDPANRALRYQGDLWIRDDRIVAPPDGARADQTILASGRVIMPGGVDMHSHFAGPAINAVRKMVARRQRVPHDCGGALPADPSRPFVPEIVTTGLRYAGLGYTTVIDAAIPATHARRAAWEISQMPIVDGAFLLLAGDDPRLLQSVSRGDQSGVNEFVRAQILATGAAGLKLVSPGAVHDWKRGFRDAVNDIDRRLASIATTPRAIIQSLSRAVDEIGLPHPLHIHCNNLGMPGNWKTTLATMQALEDRRGHLAHIQFHSYRGADDEDNFATAVQPLLEYVESHGRLSVDVGQIMFGSTMTVTADSPLAFYLRQISGKPWISHDTTHAGGCGIVPIRYRRRDRVHALQWAIGLEWMLCAKNLWQIALSTDHPNGASFLVYPQIIALLMDRDLRREQIARVHASMPRYSLLNEIDRQYSLEEVAIITRAAPARLLGLADKGHLGPGAVADVVIYEADSDPRTMFEFPRTVIKSGRIVVDNGQLLDFATDEDGPRMKMDHGVAILFSPQSGHAARRTPDPFDRKLKDCLAALHVVQFVHTAGPEP